MYGSMESEGLEVVIDLDAAKKGPINIELATAVPAYQWWNLLNLGDPMYTYTCLGAIAMPLRSGGIQEDFTLLAATSRLKPNSPASRVPRPTFNHWGQSVIWLYEDGYLTPRWVNRDNSTSDLYTVYYPNSGIFGMMKNITAFNTFRAPAYGCIYKFSPL